MKYLWSRTTKCKEEPSPAEKRLQLLKEYTFRLPHKKKPDVFGKKKKWPEDVFPPDFKYRSTCEPRTFRLSKYFEDYLETVQPPLPEINKPKTTRATKVMPNIVGNRESDMNPIMADLEESRDHGSKQILKRRREPKTSMLWSLSSMDVLIKEGMVHQEKMEQLYKTRLGSTIFTKDSFNPYKVYNWGEKGSGIHSLGPIQDFRKLRSTYLKNKELFKDPYFPATESSLRYTDWKHGVVGWKRPSELCDNPKLFVDGVSRFDVMQGVVGNCWMLAALCSLTMKRKLFFQVVPLDQAFDEMYAGIFHFRLWLDGKWIDVVIDDQLPVNEFQQLVFVHASSHNEFWPALLEKAYAKMQGTYESTIGGISLEAFIEFTGGLVEVAKLQSADCFAKMKDAWDRDALICIHTRQPSDANNPEEKLPQGLVLGHAYTITNVVDASFRTISGPLVKEQLLRIRNPWGQFEWNGAWSDKSREWNSVPDKIRRDLGLKVADDGEFWMALGDAQMFFEDVNICHVSPSAVGDKWILSMVEGEWVRGVSSGGSREKGTYYTNPQYLLKIFGVSESTRVIISLLTKNRRRLKHLNHTDLGVNINVFSITKNDPKPLTYNFLQNHFSLHRNLNYECNRDMIRSYELHPGLYVVIPSCYNTSDEGGFLLRFYSEKKIKVCSYDNQIGIDDEIYSEGYAVEYDQHAEEAEDEENAIIELPFGKKEEVGIHSDQEIANKFMELAGVEEVINWVKLQSLLGFALENVVAPGSLSKDVCRSLIALYDKNSIGALYYAQFFVLWREIIFWMEDFDRHKDSNNEISAFALRESFHDAGFTSSQRLLNLIMHRYGNKRGTLDLHDFLMAIIKFKHMIEAFWAHMNNRNRNIATFGIGEFFEVTVYS